jgi:hypothetical protein
VKIKLSFLLLAIAGTIGCFHTARFYPVAGPLSAQTPVPVLVGKMTGALNSGDFSVTLGSGEVCKGRWAVVHQPTVPKGEAAAKQPDDNGMPAAWDSVYGPGFYVAHVLGAKLHAEAKLTGDRGNVLNVELYRPPDEHPGSVPGSIKGVAKDTQGNIYKVAV